MDRHTSVGEERALLQVLDTDGDGKLTREEYNLGFDAVDTDGLCVCNAPYTRTRARARAHTHTHTHMYVYI